MKNSVWRAGRALGFLATIVSLAACAVVAPPAPSSSPPATPAAACIASLGDQWRVAVEMDRSTGSAIALVSGDSIAMCRTGPDRSVGFGPIVTGIGRHPTVSPSTLSYLAGESVPSGDGMSVLVGRVPPTTNAVRMSTGDGARLGATVGGGLWLGWLEPPGLPVLIEALDASGAVVGRLTDPNGLSPAD